jgi:hypothetical protein
MKISARNQLAGRVVSVDQVVLRMCWGRSGHGHGPGLRSLRSRRTQPWLREFGDQAPQSVAVNLSSRQIQDPGIVADVELALSNSGLEPSTLTLEITEKLPAR